jgi:hypothetical protein
MGRAALLKRVGYYPSPHERGAVTSSHFDSTAKHPDWLGGDAPDVQKLAPPAA